MGQVWGFECPTCKSLGTHSLLEFAHTILEEDENRKPLQVAEYMQLQCKCAEVWDEVRLI